MAMKIRAPTTPPAIAPVFVRLLPSLLFATLAWSAELGETGGEEEVEVDEDSEVVEDSVAASGTVPCQLFASGTKFCTYTFLLQ